MKSKNCTHERLMDQVEERGSEETGQNKNNRMNAPVVREFFLHGLACKAVVH